MDSQVYLSWTDPTSGEFFEIASVLPVSIGRHPHCTITFSDLLISTYHAEITQQQGQIFLSDNNSSNGTYLNGQMCRSSQPQPLNNDDQITLGSHTLHVKLPQHGSKMAVSLYLQNDTLFLQSSGTAPLPITINQQTALLTPAPTRLNDDDVVQIGDVELTIGRSSTPGLSIRCLHCDTINEYQPEQFCKTCGRALASNGLTVRI